MGMHIIVLLWSAAAAALDYFARLTMVAALSGFI